MNNYLNLPKITDFTGVMSQANPASYGSKHILVFGDCSQIDGVKWLNGDLKLGYCLRITNLNINCTGELKQCNIYINRLTPDGKVYYPNLQLKQFFNTNNYNEYALNIDCDIRVFTGDNMFIATSGTGIIYIAAKFQYFATKQEYKDFLASENTNI